MPQENLLHVVIYKQNVFENVFEKINLYLYLLTASVFILIIFYNLINDGMDPYSKLKLIEC